MNLKRKILKNTFFLTILYISISICVNIIMIFISKNIENIVSLFENNCDGSFYSSFFTILVLALLYFILSYLYYFIYYLADSKARKLSIEYSYSNYLNQSYNFFNKKSVGGIVYSIVHLSSEIGVFYSTFYPSILVNVLTILILFVTISRYNIVFACGILLSISILIILTSIISSKISSQTDKQETLSSKRQEEFVQSFTNISVIKMLKVEKHFSHFFNENVSKNKYKADVNKNIWYSLYVVLYDVLTIILPILVLLFGFLLSNMNYITIGGILATYSITGLLQEPIRNIADSITYYKEHKSRLSKVDYDNVEIEGVEINNSTINTIDLEIDELKINDNLLLNDIKLKIKESDIIAIKGATGSGKSSILKMIIGIYPYKNYKCYYNGVEQSQISHKQIFDSILMVEQTPLLFSASLKENICMMEEFDNDLLEQVVSICQLDEVVLKYGFDKKINMDSSNISGGEKQRISIARVLIRKPKILLLDEVTSALDSETANNLAKRIIAFVKENNIILITVSHKNEFEKYSTFILDLDLKKEVDGGEINEKGCNKKN